MRCNTGQPICSSLVATRESEPESEKETKQEAPPVNVNNDVNGAELSWTFADASPNFNDIEASNFQLSLRLILQIA